jgi:hypothetical protein
MIPPIKLGWVAGVIDLRGRLITKNNRQRATPQMVLMVESKETRVIRELSNLTGTRPEEMNQRPLKDFMRRGCSEHCPEAHIHIHDEDDRVMPPIARWTVTGAGMYVVLSNVLPYIQIDRGYTEAMDTVLANTVLLGQGSAAVRASLQRLYSLGWELPEEFKEAVSGAPA